jgi:hypothetical protein
MICSLSTQQMQAADFLRHFRTGDTTAVYSVLKLDPTILFRNGITSMGGCGEYGQSGYWAMPVWQHICNWLRAGARGDAPAIPHAKDMCVLILQHADLGGADSKNVLTLQFGLRGRWPDLVNAAYDAGVDPVVPEPEHDAAEWGSEIANLVAARFARPRNDDKEDEKLCCICLDQPRTCGGDGCVHACMCRACAEALQPKMCPLCRQPFVFIQ